MRKVKDSDLVGKTIKSIKNTALNVLTLTFTDGTSIELWAEQGLILPDGMIPGIFVNEPETE